MSRTPLSTRVLRVISLGAVATMLAACGAGERDATAPATNDGATTAAAEETGGTDEADGIAAATEYVASFADAPAWPEFDALSSPADVTGKRFTYIAFGEQVPVMHAIGVGVQQALEAAGASVSTCDGKFNPTAVATCLKTAGDEGVDGVITSFVDYEMAAPAFEALVETGVKVIVAGVAPSGGREADENLAFYDNTPRVIALHEAMSQSALAQIGPETNALWVRLMDSTTTQDASQAGIDKITELCPTCTVANTEFTTVTLDKLGSAVSAALVSNPDTNAVIVPVDSFVPPVLQGIQSAGFADRVKVFSSSSDVAGLQRIKDGQQASDLGTPVLYEGWRFAHAMMQLLAGDEVTLGDEFVSRDFTAANVADLALTPEAYLSDDWFGGSGYQDNFLTSWGLK